MRTQTPDHEAYPHAAIAPNRAQKGSIVNISSGLAIASQSGIPAYCGAKAGVCAITRSDALDYATKGIRVNSVLPGIVDSPMTNPSPEVREFLMENPVKVRSRQNRTVSSETHVSVIPLLSVQIADISFFNEL